MRNKSLQENGQSMIEVIVAVTVGILVVTALTFATIFSLRNASFSKNQSQATKLAQEGIEWVRTGRDRNSNINNAVNISGCTGVRLWSDIWSCQIQGSGLCDNPGPPVSKCYFYVNSTGQLDSLGSSSSFPSLAEGIPSGNPVFRRVVILSDDSGYATQKTATVIVTWTDFAGAHESRLTTILGKL